MLERTIPEESSADHLHLATHRDIVFRLTKDYLLFGGLRGGTSAFYNHALIGYVRNNPTVIPDFSITLSVAAMFRELPTPVGNSIKDAMDAKNIPRLQELHRISLFAGINPALATWLVSQTYVTLLPYLGRSASHSQLWIFPTLTLPATFALMGLTSEYIYGSIRNPFPTLLLFLASGPVMLLADTLLNLLGSTATYLTIANGIQCLFFIIAFMIFLERKYPNERVIKNMIEISKWKASYFEACHINRLGIQPALIVSSEVMAAILQNQLLDARSLSAFHPMSAAVMGIGGILAQTFQQRNQVHSRNILNKLTEHPLLLRRALRRMLLHAAWLSMIIPVTAGCIAMLANDYFISVIYKAANDNADIISEALRNTPFMFIALTERFIAAGPSGMIFAVRNSAETYHKQLNKYSSIVRIVNPLMFVALGYVLNDRFDLGSTGYWLGSVIAYAVSNVINATLAWKLIEYEYLKSMRLTGRVVSKPSSCFATLWHKSKEVEAIPLTAFSADTSKEETPLNSPTP
jgi:hypothetical protein